MIDAKINAEIAIEFFRAPAAFAFEFTRGRWESGRRAGQLCAATEMLVNRVKELGLEVNVDPSDGLAYCKEALRQLRATKGAE